jgi:hypothetical protein
MAAFAGMAAAVESAGIRQDLPFEWWPRDKASEVWSLPAFGSMHQSATSISDAAAAERKQTAGIVLQYLKARGFTQAAEQLQKDAVAKVSN